ncbi:MAG: hypothetical protein ACI4SF_06695 [Oscillospiraceae bacterium]
MLNNIKKIFESDRADVSLGLIINMEDKTETFIIGSTSNLKSWAENKFPDVLPTNTIKHTNELGSVIKSINKLIRFKRETDAFLEDYEQLCNIEVYCAESYNNKLESLAVNYENGDHVNMFLNLIILNTYNQCVSARRKFNNPKNILKINAPKIKEAEKHINLFKANTDKHMSVLSMLRNKKHFDLSGAINENADSFYNTSVLKAVGADGNRKTMYLCDINTQEGLMTFLEMYADVLGTYGLEITNCEICGSLMVTNVSKPSLTCSRADCRKKYHNKVNSDCRRASYKNPIEKAYLAFTGACRTYRKKLLRSETAISLYDKKYDEIREAVLTKKNALPKKSNSEIIENFKLYCDKEKDQLREFSNDLKKKYIMSE